VKFLENAKELDVIIFLRRVVDKFPVDKEFRSVWIAYKLRGNYPK